MEWNGITPFFGRGMYDALHVRARMTMILGEVCETCSRLENVARNQMDRPEIKIFLVLCGQEIVEKWAKKDIEKWMIVEMKRM